MTSSPGLKRVTPGPTASTTPAASMPTSWFLGARMPMNRRTKPGFGFRPSRSARLTDAARTRTSTWSSDGVGRSTSLSSTTSGGPYRSWNAAFMRLEGHASACSITSRSYRERPDRHDATGDRRAQSVAPTGSGAAPSSDAASSRAGTLRRATAAPIAVTTARIGGDAATKWIASMKATWAAATSAAPTRLGQRLGDRQRAAERVPRRVRDLGGNPGRERIRDLGPVHGRADAAEDRDPERAAELAARLGHARWRRRPAPAGRCRR